MTAPINYCGNETYPLNPTMMPTGPRTEENSPSGVSLRSADAFTPDAPAGEFEQVQADWNQVDSSKADFIKNKPTIVSVPVLPSEDGSYVLKITSGVASWVATEVTTG